MMSRYENKSVKEIAEALNVTVKGADYHISKSAATIEKEPEKIIFYTLLFF